ncbi:MAG: putative quinol monooxygenase [Sporichthyaceae bacterium]|jgi:quinol monooxygenase YgiN
MILINVKFPVKPERIEEWIALAEQYRKDVCAEEGNVYFEWARGLEDPNVFYAIECFRDMEAGGAHMGMPHTAHLIAVAPDLVSAQPEVVFVDSPSIAGWAPMGEIQPR